MINNRRVNVETKQKKFFFKLLFSALKCLSNLREFDFSERHSIGWFADLIDLEELYFLRERDKLVV